MLRNIAEAFLPGDFLPVPLPNQTTLESGEIPSVCEALRASIEASDVICYVHLMSFA
jgi:hypothetical protein